MIKLNTLLRMNSNIDFDQIAISDLKNRLALV